MKRGRPSKRYEIYALIEEYFLNNPYPSNVRRISEFVSQRIGKPISWNTVKKYLEELVRIDKLKKIRTQHSKNPEKEGITLYYMEVVKNE